MLGERIPVLTAENESRSIRRRRRFRSTLPAAAENAQWTQSGGNAANSMGQVALGNALAPAFTVQAGRGSSLTARLAAPPIVANGRVYTIDTLGAVRAFDAADGGRSGQPDSRRSRAMRLAVRRRNRLRQRPHLRDQRPGLRRRAERADRRDPVEGAPGRATARRSDGRRRRGLCDQPGQPDLLAQGSRRLDQLVAGGLARDRRHIRGGFAGGRRRAQSSPASRRASSMPTATRTAARCGRTRCSARASAPACRRCPTSTPTR